MGIYQHSSNRTEAETIHFQQLSTHLFENNYSK